MNTLPLTMIGFVCGMCFCMMNSMPIADVEAAIYEAYMIGKAECPRETVCIEAVKLADVEPISFNDIKYGEF